MGRGESRFPWLKVVVIAIAMSAAVMTFAAGRKVSIPLSGTSLELTNGSDVAVAFSVTCYGSGNGLQTTNFNYTLTARASTNFYLSSGGSSNHPGCTHTSGTTWINNDTRLVICNAGWWTTTNSDAAAALCNTSAGFHQCTMAEMAAIPGYSNSGYYAWISSNGVGSFQSNGGGWTNFPNAQEVPVYNAGSTNYQCASGAGGSGTIYNSCGSYYTGNAAHVACCGATGPALAMGSNKSCDVSISSSTPTSGFLQSPQWKANTPF